MKPNMRVLLLGDLMGEPGLAMFTKHSRTLIEKYKVDCVIVNGENSAPNGRGITTRVIGLLKEHGAHVITTGNHVWNNKDIFAYFDEGHDDVLRPANFPNQCPGKGLTFVTLQGVTIAVVNMQGRVFMRENLDCPFRTLDSLLHYIKSKTNIILVDFHAETTAEKLGFGLYFDGKVSGIVGTHTHVPTADARILPKGTGYITDLGFAGSYHSMIGMKAESVMPTFIDQMPSKFVVETQPPFIMSGVVMDIDTQTGLTKTIEQIKIIDDSPLFSHG
jgi:metallophosphoesterase (TIGR00282 family)